MRNTKGFVYLAVDSNGLYKIGCSIDPRKRIRGVGYTENLQLTPICFIPTDRMFVLENRLHNHFRDKRIKGMCERFALTKDDVKYILSISTVQRFNINEVKLPEVKVVEKEKSSSNDFSAILEWYNARRKAS